MFSLDGIIKQNNPDLSDQIISYEAGEMGEDEEIGFFQALIDTGMIWDLQGSYVDKATTLINAGLCYQTNPVAIA